MCQYRAHLILPLPVQQVLKVNLREQGRQDSIHYVQVSLWLPYNIHGQQLLMNVQVQF